MPHRRGERPSLAGRTVLAVFAHPDDEALACGGTLARLADAGAKIVLLCASRGERGSVSDPALVLDGNLGRARTHELHAAAEVLGISEVLVYDHPDGSLRWKDAPELHKEIVAAITRYRPDAVITFDEDGLYWHGDHVGIHERTSDAVLSVGADAPALYYVTMPRGAMRHVVDRAVAKGWSQPQGGFWGIMPDAFGLQAQTPTIELDIGEWVPRKLAALECHRTQMGAVNPFSMIDEAEARRWLGLEYFRRAPIGRSRGDFLEQLGEPVVGSASGSGG